MAKGTVNKVILLGRLGANPEVRQTQNGTIVATINLATNEVFKEETQTEWHSVVIFGKGAEVIQQYCKKGDALYVEGRIRTNKWQDTSGQNRYSTEIIANNFQLLGSGNNQNMQPKPDFNNFNETKIPISTTDSNDYDTAPKNNVPSFDEINSSNSDQDDIPF